MSVHAAETVLWKISNEPHETERFIKDRRAYLGSFQLDDDERNWIETLDIRRLSDRGVNPLLLLSTYRAVKGPDSIPEYMQRMTSQ